MIVRILKFLALALIAFTVGAAIWREFGWPGVWYAAALYVVFRVCFLVMLRRRRR